MRGSRVVIGALAACFASPAASGAQVRPADDTRFAPDAFLDPVARQIYTTAYDQWDALGDNIERYTARIDQRIEVAVRALRRKRTLYHSQSAVRAFWERDREPVIQVLGSAAQYPFRELSREVYLDIGNGGSPWWLQELPFDTPFEPGSDQLFVGADRNSEPFQPADDAPWLAHPLGEGADTLYRFQSGDTISLEFPDGQRFDAIRLNVLPRRSDPHLISGSLWIDAATGGLARGVYRLARPFELQRDIPDAQAAFDSVPPFVPDFLFSLAMEIKVVAVDYSIWDFEVWLPNTFRIEAEVRYAGMVKVPVTMDFRYQIESVAMTEDLLAEAEGEATGMPPLQEVHFDTRAEAMAFIAELLSEDGEPVYQPLADDYRGARWIAPEDPADIEESPHLPPPIWNDAPGFPSDDDLDEYMQILDDIPGAPAARTLLDFNWGWAQTDLVRYNRVEGPAVGGRVGWPIHGPYDLRASGFFGFADLRPKVRLDLERSSVFRRLKLGAYHELRPTESESGYLGMGNTLEAFLYGRDNGEYYQATGADFTWRPPEIAVQSFQLRVYGERQGPVENNTNFALFRAFDRGWDFRDNVEAREVEEVGGELRLSPWWGHNPAGAQLGIELFGRAATWRVPGEEARENYGQASATVRAVVPVSGRSWSRWRIGMEAAGGNTWGQAPVQRSWFLGSAATLRGFPASTVSGLSFLRGRVEVGRTYQGFAASFFGDAGWAGPVGEFDSDDVLYGVGVGGSMLDGLIRLDLSQGLRGPRRQFRVELYLNSIL